MKQKDKELLFKDLCARLPYNTIVSMAEGEIDFIECKIKWNKEELTLSLLHQIKEDGAWEFVKPYLRPMSSMTDEEKKEFNDFCVIDKFAWKGNSEIGYKNQAIIMSNAIDWLLKKHFDIFDLISKGLAIEVTEENNPYKIA